MQLPNLHKMAHELLNTAKMNISTVTAIHISHASSIKNSVLMKRTYSSSEEWIEMPIAKKRVKLLRDIPINLSGVKNIGVIEKEKLDDLKKKDDTFRP